MIDRPAAEAVSKVLQGAELARLGRGLPEAFDVSLITTAGAVTLHCDAVLRVLPGRRIVARAIADGRTVLAKLFVGSRALVERQWEERGHAAFVRAGVATPEIVGRGTMVGGGEALTVRVSRRTRRPPTSRICRKPCRCWRACTHTAWFRTICTSATYCAPIMDSIWWTAAASAAWGTTNHCRRTPACATLHCSSPNSGSARRRGSSRRGMHIRWRAATRPSMPTGANSSKRCIARGVRACVTTCARCCAIAASFMQNGALTDIWSVIARHSKARWRR